MKSGTRESEIGWLAQKYNVVRAAWKIVLAGTIGLFALGTAGVLASNGPAFTSKMVLPLSARLLGLLRSDAVLAPVAKSTVAGSEPSDSNAARQMLADKITVSPEMSRGSGLYTVSVTDRTPERAQATLEKILEQVLALSKPTGSLRTVLLQELETLKRMVGDLRRLSEKLKDNAERVKGGNEGEMYARAFVFLVSEIGAKEHKILEVNESFQGLRIEDVIIRPTLPATPEPRGVVRKLVVVGLASLLLSSISVIFLSGTATGRSQFGGFRSPAVPKNLVSNGTG